MIVKFGGTKLNEKTKENYGFSIMNSYEGTITVNRIKVMSLGNGSIGGLYIEKNSAVNVYNGVFVKNKAVYGGAIHIVENDRILIDNCQFLLNEAKISGGAIFLNRTIFFEISNSKFIENISPLGSSISFIILLTYFRIGRDYYIQIHNNDFLIPDFDRLNKTRFDLFYIDFGPYHQYFCSNDYLNNGSHNDDFSISCKCSNNFEKPSLGLRTSKFIPQMKNFTLYLSILVYNFTPIIFNNSFKFFSNQSQISDIIYFDPDATSMPTFKSPFNKSFTGISSLNSSSFLTLRMAQCLLGEIFVIDHLACKKCDPGAVSLNFDGSECHICPLGAECYQGGFNLSVRAGFWRDSRYSYNIFQCDNAIESCLGGLDSICATGYTGPKCQACDNENGYMLSFEKGCKKCGENDVSSLFFILIHIFVFIFEAYYMYTAYVMNKLYCEDEFKDSFSQDYMEEKKRTCMYFRVLTLYLQVLAIIQSINLRLPEIIQTVFKSLGSPNNTILYSSGCFLFGLSKRYIYLELIISNVMLVSKLVLIFLIWFIARLIHPNTVNRRMLIVAFTSLVYFEQPGILANLSSMLGCETIGNNSYLVKDYNFICDDETYKTYSYILVMPGLIIWGLIFPLMVLGLLINSRKTLHDKKTKMMLGFFYCPYKRQYYFWEIVQIFFKMTLILLSYVILYDVKTKGLSFILVIAVFWAISHVLEPYDDFYFKYFNQILEASNIFFISLLFFSLYSRDNSYEFLQTSADIIVISLNAFFAILMIVVLCVIFKNRVKRIIRWMKLKYHIFRSKQKKRENKKKNSIWKRIKILLCGEKIEQESKDEITDDESNLFDIMIEESEDKYRKTAGESDGNVDKHVQKNND